ncbi:YSIRK-type signal peptide-containing protein, partial [Enterococcus faecalis]|uniref:YSIRK-type signal peptide-containing protein n=1 Tax=Enterococcus faecalis TaxID=1351 RepID=UPI0034E48FB0
MNYSKKNLSLKREKCTEKIRKYSIKKLGIGVASVLIGSIFYLGTGVQVQADEISTSELSIGITDKISLLENENNEKNQGNESVDVPVVEKTEDSVGTSSNTEIVSDMQASEVVDTSEKTKDSVGTSSNTEIVSDMQASEVVDTSEKTKD